MTLALITNDDGIDSPGIAALTEAALQAGLDVIVAAPSWDTSGASASLTGVRQDGKLLVEPRRRPGVGLRAFAVEAAPAMITVTALRGGFGAVPDIVLSGVNRGRNIGHAVLHSGTVGAALTASNYGVASLAVSIDAASPSFWDTARATAVPVIAWLAEHRPGCTVNLNVPDRPIEELKGVRTAPLAEVGAVQTHVTEVGEGYVQLTFEPDDEPAPGTDAALLAAGWAVLTAIRPLTDAPDPALERLAEDLGATVSR